MKERDPEKLQLLYERFRDVCLVEKEVWYEIFMPRDVKDGIRLTNVQDRYKVVLEKPEIESVLDANIPMGPKAMDAAIAEFKDSISFIKE